MDTHTTTQVLYIPVCKVAILMCVVVPLHSCNGTKLYSCVLELLSDSSLNNVSIKVSKQALTTYSALINILFPATKALPCFIAATVPQRERARVYQ